MLPLFINCRKLGVVLFWLCASHDSGAAMKIKVLFEMLQDLA